ncbi:MAG: glycosyltransferase family 2 protein [Pseudohongiellaceae bacterium]
MADTELNKGNPKVAILLSVYNGQAFLEEQLNSLLQQTYSEFVIVVRDDCSKDKSLEIIRSYAQKSPSRFHVLAQDDRNLGASGGFAFLMEYVLQHKLEIGLESAYMMFCDQDDIWQSNKLELQMKAMKETESSLGGGATPILVHSDLQVVAADASEIAPSFVAYQGLEIHRNRFPNLVISNLVTGCTACLNESLARKSLPIPANAVMHDWWLAIVVSAFGKLVYLDKALLKYRQHDNNTIGATKYEPKHIGFWRRVITRKPNPHLIEVGIQAQEFKKQFGKELSRRNNLALFLSAHMRIPIGIIQRIFYRLARRF